MTDPRPSFWSPPRVAAVIGVIVLVATLAVLAALPQNQYVRGDLLEPISPVDAELGYWMVNTYDQEYDLYHLHAAFEDEDNMFTCPKRTDGVWLPRKGVEGTFRVIGSFDRRKAHL